MIQGEPHTEGGLDLIGWIGPGLARMGISMCLDCLLVLLVQRNGMAKCADYIDISLLYCETERFVR